MKSLLQNQIFILFIRIFLGGLFIIASLDKIADPNAFSISILNYKVVGATLSMLTATILPWLELLCGLSLILGLYPRGSALLITVMLAVFTIIIASALLRGLDISCGCFSQDPNASKIGYQKILENTGLIFLGIYLFLTSQHEINLIRIFKKRQSKNSG